MATWIEADPSITAACDMETTRYAFAGVEIRKHPTKKEMVISAATNSRILAIGEMSGEADKPVIVPATIFPKSQKELGAVSKAKGNRKYITLDAEKKQWESQAYGRLEPEIDARFPKYTDIMPQLNGRILQLMIDASLLESLATAVGCNDSERGITLLIDIDSPIRDAEEQLPDEATFRDDVKAHVLSASRPAGRLVLAVEPNTHGIETIEDAKRFKAVTKLGWIMVDSMPDEATADEWADVLWHKVYADVMRRHLHVRNAIPVAGNHRVGVIMPMTPERKGVASDESIETYERICKLARQASGIATADEYPPYGEAGPASGPEDNPTDEIEQEKPGDDGSGDGGDGNDMNLQHLAETEPPQRTEPPQTNDETADPVVNPMAALMALAAL